MSSTNFIKLNNYYQLVQEDNISETDSTQRGIIYIYPPENGTSIAKYGTGTQGETLATAPCIGSNGGGASNLPLITVSSTNTAQANYTHTITGDANAIFGKGATTVAGSGNLLTGHQGSKNITGSGNFVIGNGGTNYIKKGTSGDSVGNILVGSSVSVTGSYNMVDGATHTITGLYNIVSGRNHEIAGDYNVITGTGEFGTAKTVVTGKGNFVSGDFSSSTISGNYNSIICGGGNNTITGDDPISGTDKSQHNIIIGSTTTITKSESCLTLGRNNTITNHNRTVLLGLGLTATRDNQLIVGSYNDETKTGGAFVVGNGTADSHSNAMTVYAEGTVTIGHDPIGPMDVVTKHYLEEVLLKGTW